MLCKVFAPFWLRLWQQQAFLLCYAMPHAPATQTNLQPRGYIFVQNKKTAKQFEHKANSLTKMAAR